MYEVNYMHRKYHLSSLALITRSEYGKQACKKKNHKKTLPDHDFHLKMLLM